MAGKQCHLRLWNECFARELATPIDEAQQAIFDTGHEVGELAMGRYPGGVMIAEGPRELAAARERTSAAMAGDAPAIFEAAFEHQGVTCRVDVLVRAPNGEWDLVEVKSTGSAKDVHVEDLAVYSQHVRLSNYLPHHALGICFSFQLHWKDERNYKTEKKNK